MSQSRIDEPTMYCRECSYVLDALPENRCPECGKSFDPQNPGTFRRAAVVPRRLTIIIAMYVTAWLLCYGFWTGLAAAHRHIEPWNSGWFAALLSSCGLLSWVFLNYNSWLLIFIGCPVIWATWLVLVCRLRRLRDLPYAWHLLLGILWWCSGCPPAGIVIT